MKKTVVIYKSHYGSTKKYAEWLSKDLDCDLLEMSDIKKSKLQDYEVIIYGGGLYASGINGISLITKNFNELKMKSLVVFTVGLGDPHIEEQFQPIIKKNFTPEMIEHIKLFHLRGGIDYKNLSFIHRKMMGMMNKIISKKAEAERTDEDNQFLETFGNSIDFSDESTITPILSYVKSLS